MTNRRNDRVGHLVQMELGQILLHRMKDPRMIGFVTITHVSMANDLKSARVFYSVLGDEKIKTSTQIALEKATGFLQHEIGEALKLRYTPKLTFALDESYDKGMEIDRVLYNLKKENKNSK